MDIITTIGPSSQTKQVIQKLSASGADYFRINLSHSTKQSLEYYIGLISGAGVKPSLDTQGAQIRLLEIDGIKKLTVGDRVAVLSEKTKDSGFNAILLPINHREVFSQIRVGNKIRIDFDGAIVQITEVESKEEYAFGTVLSEGTIRSNRAIDIIDNPVQLSCLTEFDTYALDKHLDCIEAIFLSFTNHPQDVKKVLSLIDGRIDASQQRPKVIAKIESKMGIYNIEDILPLVDGILIDRGDLSREISISYIPVATNSLIDICKKFKKPCYIATNILDSMMKSSLPSRAEVSDLYNLFSLGASGIVLASEVAIGNNPIDSVRVVKHIYNVFKSTKNSTLAFLPKSHALKNLPEHLAEWL